MIHAVSFDEVKSGKITDVYFERTLEILKAKGVNKTVKAEFVAKGLPRDWTWGVLAGNEEAHEILKDLPVKVRMMPEGTTFRTWEPVLEISGPYLDFGRFETALLGLFCQASGVATMAGRCKIAAGFKPVLSFGARRMHPVIAAMIERNAYVGGCDGVAVSRGAELIGQP
ncbi:MAG: nicotinate phosphoribosyltransferase, partial [Deltaproteobacteria bacterium]|nr:nicotinate phosphoribosyltransferase [Deltaproteobacteria bacterium]